MMHFDHFSSKGASALDFMLHFGNPKTPPRIPGAGLVVVALAKAVYHGWHRWSTPHWQLCGSEQFRPVIVTMPAGERLVHVRRPSLIHLGNSCHLGIFDRYTQGPKPLPTTPSRTSH